MSLNKISLIAILTVLLFSSSDLYAQWILVSTFNYSGINPASISVTDPNTVWVGGGTNVPLVYRSTNGGLNWISATGNLNLDIYCIWGKDSNSAYCGDGGATGGSGGNAKVYKTTNGGISWSVILSTGGTYGFINGIVFSRTNPQVGIIESDPPLGNGQPYWVMLTINNGANWTLQQPPGVQDAASAQNSVMCIDASFYGYGLNAGAPRVTLTSNGGLNWFTRPLNGLSYPFVSSLAFNSDKIHGIACTSQDLPFAAMTSNGGENWSSVNLGTGLSGSSLSAVKWIPGTEVIYLVAQNSAPNASKRSTDGGNTWTTLTTAGLSALTHVDAYKETNNVIHAYAVAIGGFCFRFRDSVLFTGINNNNNNIPVEYSLEQNYPNPFNPTTVIKYALPRSSNVSLKIYDMLGNEVKTVVNEFKTAGTYSVNFDASSLSSGVYFYKIVAGDFTDAKKMTLVK
jgi:photosystem II stability/assembly factor-like uncharacterized protein